MSQEGAVIYLEIHLRVDELTSRRNQLRRASPRAESSVSNRPGRRAQIRFEEKGNDVLEVEDLRLTTETDYLQFLPGHL